MLFSSFTWEPRVCFDIPMIRYDSQIKILSFVLLLFFFCAFYRIIGMIFANFQPTCLDYMDGKLLAIAKINNQWYFKTRILFRDRQHFETFLSKDLIWIHFEVAFDPYLEKYLKMFARVRKSMDGIILKTNVEKQCCGFLLVTKIQKYETIKNSNFANIRIKKSFIFNQFYFIG